MSRHVTVIVPVYRGRRDVERCLESVIAHAAATRVGFDLVVVDDASPEPAVSALLDTFAAREHAVPVRLLRNDSNRGFVASCNRALRDTTGDVVLLNSDTVVTAGWLDRLHAAATSTDDVATVTPLTNSGSICTLPRSIIAAFGLETADPRVDECAAFVARTSLGLRPEVISGVGFCMYTTRDALDATGLLDEDTFGLGYGEEVDFCLRATRLGFRHLAEDSTFVYHRGFVSFGAQRDERRSNSSALLHDRYRFFHDANSQERSRDPLRVPFAALELGLTERRPDRPHVLHVLHSPPSEVGGTEKHLRVLMESLLDRFDFSVLFPLESGFGLRTCWDVGVGDPVEHEFLLPGAARRVTATDDEVAGAAIETALEMFDFDAVHLQNLIGHSLAPLRVLAGWKGPVVCSVRDLYLACPNHSLLYRNVDPCGIPDDLAMCARCLPETRGMTVDELVDFRRTVETNLHRVDHWVFASRSAADYFLRAYDVDEHRIEIIEHGAIIDIDTAARDVDAELVLTEPLRVAFVGLGWAKKGLDVVNRLADAVAGTSIEVHHFGELRERASPQLQVHGPYDNELLPWLLQRAGIHIVLLPGPYAETFGHVMTESLVAGRPVVGAGYGALGERIRNLGAGWTIDPSDPDALIALVRNLDRCRDEVLRATRRARAVALHPVAATAPAYAALYEPKTEART